jgi:hypothetical protein
MEYSEELAGKINVSTWQCINCKTCAICKDSNDDVSAKTRVLHQQSEIPTSYSCFKVVMLFCDSCDLGYHLTCHIPPLTEKVKH